MEVEFIGLGHMGSNTDVTMLSSDEAVGHVVFDEGDAAYFSRRAREERIAALKAVHPRARESHRQMAEANEYRVRIIAAEDRRLAIRLIHAA